MFANSPRLNLSDSTEVGGIDFRARNNFSRLTGLVLLASKRVISFLIICDDATDSLVLESLKCYLQSSDWTSVGLPNT
jgi:hypothetical protein